MPLGLATIPFHSWSSLDCALCALLGYIFHAKNHKFFHNFMPPTKLLCHCGFAIHVPTNSSKCGFAKRSRWLKLHQIFFILFIFTYLYSFRARVIVWLFVGHFVVFLFAILAFYDCNYVLGSAVLTLIVAPAIM